jgi:putative transposase
MIERQRGSPRTIKTDNGSEFIGKAMDRWAYERAVELDFSRPASPRTTPTWKASTAACARNA